MNVAASTPGEPNCLGGYGGWGVGVGFFNTYMYKNRILKFGKNEKLLQKAI
jgi:hypothetical protein